MWQDGGDIREQWQAKDWRLKAESLQIDCCILGGLLVAAVILIAYLMWWPVLGPTHEVAQHGCVEQVR